MVADDRELTAYYECVSEAAAAVRARVPGVPTVGVVLGSGLGGFAGTLERATSIRYETVPHWPVTGVSGHEGRLVAGTLAGKMVVALAGRAHCYEGHDLRRVTFATRVLGALGVRMLILTNVAGGISERLIPGTLMVIDDHVNLMGTNPLVGPDDDRFGSRFPDMTSVYSPRLRAVADEAARAAGVSVAHGVYVAVLGPSYDTPAEIRAFRVLGADAVGMSTVPEAIVARHMGVEVLGVSCIANMAAGIEGRPLTHEEVLETAHRIAGRFSALLKGVIERM